MDTASERPFLGHGVGLRLAHYDYVLEHPINVDWIECITENFLGLGGRPRAVLERLHGKVPIAFHGVGMGLGSKEGPSEEYLTQLSEVFNAFPPAWVSDHLCWTSLGGHHSHDLLPLPHTRQAVEHVAQQVCRVQDRLGRRLVVENVSSYVQFTESTMNEWEFLGEVAVRADCWILLDLNNVVVNGFNHGYEPKDFIVGLPSERVVQFHLANHCQRSGYKFDSHLGPVPESVWALYEFALGHMGPVSSLIEWDEGIPTWNTLVAEQRKAARFAMRFSSGVSRGENRSAEPERVL